MKSWKHISMFWLLGWSTFLSDFAMLGWACARWLSHFLPASCVIVGQVAEWIEPKYHEDERERETNVSHSRHGHDGLNDEFKSHLHDLQGWLLSIVVFFIDLARKWDRFSLYLLSSSHSAASIHYRDTGWALRWGCHEWGHSDSTEHHGEAEEVHITVIEASSSIDQHVVNVEDIIIVANEIFLLLQIYELSLRKCCHLSAKANVPHQRQVILLSHWSLLTCIAVEAIVYLLTLQEIGTCHFKAFIR